MEEHFYFLFFDFRGNEFFQADVVDFIIERLRIFYTRNLLIPLGANLVLFREDKDHGIEFYIQSAIDEINEAKSIALSEIKYFVVPVILDDISKYITGFEKEIELIKSYKN